MKYILLSLFLFSLLIASCSSQLSYTKDNETTHQSACSLNCQDEVQLQEYIQTYFTLAPKSYELVCSDCNFSRGGFIQAQLIKDNEPVDLYYSWGMCSSGGSDCGWEMSFTAPEANTLFASIEQMYCNKLSSEQIFDGEICLGDAQNTTALVKNDCFLGKFESNYQGKKRFAVKQIRNRCNTSVEAFLN